QEDLNLGPTRTEAYNADTDMEPLSTNAVTESAIVAYTESPLATLRKRDLEYRRLHHANSPEQRDPEKRSRSLPAEPNDDSMGSDSGSDLTPLRALDANAAEQSDLSGSQLSLETRNSLEALPFWESNNDSALPILDLVEYENTRLPIVNSFAATRESYVEESIVPFTQSTETALLSTRPITRTITSTVSRTITETLSSQTGQYLLALPEPDGLGLAVTQHNTATASQGLSQLPALTSDLLSSSSTGYQSQAQLANAESRALEWDQSFTPDPNLNLQLTQQVNQSWPQCHLAATHMGANLLESTNHSDALTAVSGLSYTATSTQPERPLQIADLPHEDPSATDMEISEIDHGLALLPTVSDLSLRVSDLQDSVRYTESSVSLQLNQIQVDQRGTNTALGSLTSAVDVASNRTQLLEEDLSSLERNFSSTRQDLQARVLQISDQVQQVGLTLETASSVTDAQIFDLQRSLAETVPKETHEAVIRTLTEAILELRQSMQDQASISHQLRSGLLSNEGRHQTELHQLHQEVQSLRLLLSDSQTRTPTKLSETRRLLDELKESNELLSACVSDLTLDNTRLLHQVSSLEDQLARHQLDLQVLRNQTPEPQQATESSSAPISIDPEEVQALFRDLNERLTSLATGLTSDMSDLKESIQSMDQDKKLGQATKFTIVPSSNHQDDCAFFIRQLLETADRCQLTDTDRRSLLGLKLCSDKTPPSLHKWWISFAKTKQGETRVPRPVLSPDLLNDSVRYEDETVRSYATRLQSIIDEVGFPADQGVNLFKLGVRHLKTESCLENTDRELKTIADCVKLLRMREVPLDDAPTPAPRPKSRSGSVSEASSTYLSEISSDRTPLRSPRLNRRGSRVSFDEPSTVEHLLNALVDQQKQFVAHIERSDRNHQSLVEAFLRPSGHHFAAPVQSSPAPQYSQPYGYPYARPSTMTPPKHYTKYGHSSDRTNYACNHLGQAGHGNDHWS
ncbi:unnamed protein product, partial [Aphanomyces euteiches]